ncbi:hypothetical protein [Streptomyces olivaceus]|uniref:hypothetical protein n=1 Tax=Streptomyces olivaceus TaxID=47716 RepID=UPI001CC9CEDA|nr:hypothetical protein [Streptomyces olivaceus]MBZ6142489.1 hypothetical protein [Streptomyces olivaceus]MBZ6170142.1 hypothetical protein [Streptomyces olivaceus]
MEPVDLLAGHGIGPVHLEPAPSPPARAQTLARVQSVPPRSCVVCGDEAATARIVVYPDTGPRWADLCWDHGMAVRPRCSLPETLEGIVSDLRAAAREVGLPGAADLAFYSSSEEAAAGRRNEEPR